MLAVVAVNWPFDKMEDLLKCDNYHTSVQQYSIGGLSERFFEQSIVFANFVFVFAV